MTLNRSNTTPAVLAGVFFCSFVGLCGVGGLAGCAGTTVKQSKADANAQMSNIRAANKYDAAMQQFQAGQYADALQTIEQGLAINDKPAPAHLLRGRILMELGRSDEAVAAIDKAIEIKPEEHQAYYYRGAALERSSKQELALQSYQTAFEMDRGNEQYAVAVAETMVDLKMADTAEQFLTGIEGELGNRPGVQQTRGHLAMLRGDRDAALKHFTQASLANPDDGAILGDLAMVQLSLKRYAEADATLYRLLQKPELKNRKDLVMLRVRTLLLTDRPVEARDMLIKIVDNPQTASEPEAWARLAEVAAMLDDPGLQQRAGERLVALAPERPEGYVALAMWQRNRSDLNGAVTNLWMAVQRSPKDGAPARLLAVTYNDMGVREQARQAVDLALRIDPNDQQALRLKESLKDQAEAPTGR
jgi:tetratricopeptide (TPR) repeat protein